MTIHGPLGLLPMLGAPLDEIIPRPNGEELIDGRRWIDLAAIVVGEASGRNLADVLRETQVVAFEVVLDQGQGVDR